MNDMSATAPIQTPGAGEGVMPPARASDAAVAQLFDAFSAKTGIAPFRHAAMQALVAHGLPSRRVEEWKYTDLRAAMPTAFSPAQSAQSTLPLTGMTPVAIGAAPVPLGLNPQPRDAVFALNAAMAEAGATLDIAAGETPVQPFHIAHAARDGLRAVRHIITLGEGAVATVIESYASTGGLQSVPLTEIRLADGAKLTHIKIVDEGDSVHAGSWHVDLGANAEYDAIHAVFGGRFGRHQTFVRYMGEGARMHYTGAQLLRGQEHCDMTLVVDHAVPKCESRETVKAVLDGRSRGVFQAKVWVRPDAQQTDGRQLAQALLLSDDAEFDAKPELEIYADDVKCNHGATAGALDEDALFYLRARGIPPAEARRLLVLAFITEVYEKVMHEPTRDLLVGMAQTRFAS